MFTNTVKRILALLIMVGVLLFLFSGCSTPEHEIELKVKPEEAGEVSGEGFYKKGKDIAVKAKAYEGYRFVEWKENGNKLSSSWNYPFVVRDDRTLIAIFEKDEEKEKQKKTDEEEEKAEIFPEVSISHSSPVLGDHLLVEIKNLDNLPEVSIQSELKGDLSKPYLDNGLIYLMWGLSYHNEPGKYPLTLKIQGLEGECWEKTKEIELLEGDFPSQQFSVSSERTEDWTAEELHEDREKTKKARENSLPEPMWHEPFNWPLEGRITSEFGAIRVINDAESRRHSGIDIAAPTGTPVKAANSGKVRLAEHLLASGKTAIIDHGLNLSSAYLHMHEINAEEGQPVEKGEVIGTVGETGFVTGAHLHWSVYIGHTPVNPHGFVE